MRDRLSSEFRGSRDSSTSLLRRSAQNDSRRDNSIMVKIKNNPHLGGIVF